MDETSDTQEGASTGAREQEARDTGSIMNFMSARKIATATWVMRWYALFLSIQYMFFCSAFEMGQYFQRALLANGIISALRLHQRVPEFRFSRAHFALLLTEDSAHYLLYTLIFLSTQPITIALMPVAVFALLHASNFTRQMLDVRGANSFPTIRKLINHVARHQATLFRFIAMNEIMIMPTTIFMAFTGRAAIFTPFLYFKFLRYRYVSKRNPYSRILFYELRIAGERMIISQNCPSPLKFLIRKSIDLCFKLAPPPSAYPPAQEQ